MRVFFPPGDTHWKRKRPQSAWREFNFLLHQVQRGIEPSISLKEVLNNWNQITKDLAERPRKRIQQMKNFL